jgi:hypothetical protein
MRRSAGEHASFDAAWREIRDRSHADVVRQLNLHDRPDPAIAPGIGQT